MASIATLLARVITRNWQSHNYALYFLCTMSVSPSLSQPNNGSFIMRKLTLFALLVSATLAANTSHADWGNLLDSVTKKGSQLIQQPLTSTSANISKPTLSSDTIINGLRDALAVGSERAISVISLDGGYLNDPQIRVPLPAGLDKLAKPLRQIGMGKQVDHFLQTINRAAERAAPHATNILLDNIRTMSFEDVNMIYKGSDDAATQYFRKKSGPQIAALFNTEVDTALNQVGATRYYNDLASKAANIPFVGKQINGDLTSHVTSAALDGLFLKIAAQEKLIRTDPAARTTDLLKTLWD